MGKKLCAVNMNRPIPKAKLEGARRIRIGVQIQQLAKLLPADMVCKEKDSYSKILRAAVEFVQSCKSRSINLSDEEETELKRLRSQIISLEERCCYYAKLLDQSGICTGSAWKTGDVQKADAAAQTDIKSDANSSILLVIAPPQIADFADSSTKNARKQNSFRSSLNLPPLMPKTDPAYSGAQMSEPEKSIGTLATPPVVSPPITLIDVDSDGLKEISENRHYANVPQIDSRSASIASASSNSLEKREISVQTDDVNSSAVLSIEGPAVVAEISRLDQATSPCFNLDSNISANEKPEIKRRRRQNTADISNDSSTKRRKAALPPGAEPCSISGMINVPLDRSIDAGLCRNMLRVDDILHANADNRSKNASSASQEVDFIAKKKQANGSKVRGRGKKQIAAIDPASSKQIDDCYKNNKRLTSGCANEAQAYQSTCLFRNNPATNVGHVANIGPSCQSQSANDHNQLNYSNLTILPPPSYQSTQSYNALRSAYPNQSDQLTVLNAQANKCLASTLADGLFGSAQTNNQFTSTQTNNHSSNKQSNSHFTSTQENNCLASAQASNHLTGAMQFYNQPVNNTYGACGKRTTSKPTSAVPSYQANYPSSSSYAIGHVASNMTSFTTQSGFSVTDAENFASRPDFVSKPNNYQISVGSNSAVAGGDNRLANKQADNLRLPNCDNFGQSANNFAQSVDNHRQSSENFRQSTIPPATSAFTIDSLHNNNNSCNGGDASVNKAGLTYNQQISSSLNHSNNFKKDPRVNFNEPSVYYIRNQAFDQYNPYSYQEPQYPTASSDMPLILPTISTAINSSSYSKTLHTVANAMAGSDGPMLNNLANISAHNDVNRLQSVFDPHQNSFSANQALTKDEFTRQTLNMPQSRFNVQSWINYPGAETAPASFFLNYPQNQSSFIENSANQGKNREKVQNFQIASMITNQCGQKNDNDKSTASGPQSIATINAFESGCWSNQPQPPPAGLQQSIDKQLSSSQSIDKQSSIGDKWPDFYWNNSTSSNLSMDYNLASNNSFMPSFNFSHLSVDN